MLKSQFKKSVFRNPNISGSFRYALEDYPWLDKVDPNNDFKWFVNRSPENTIGMAWFSDKRFFVSLVNSLRMLELAENEIMNSDKPRMMAQVHLNRFTTRLIIEETSLDHSPDVRKEALAVLQRLNDIAEVNNLESFHPHSRLVDAPQLVMD